ncbi:PaaI family thioesterase [Streptomyces avidinii]|uniref:PaaI family thioesterase n=1 Tax=Streptomyces avidinii TaxID=1895 RepID=UPI0037962C85
MTTYETSAAETGAALRSRTHTWQQRPEMTPEILGMSGLEILQASMKGELPGASMMSTLGFRLTEASEGVAVFEGEPGDHLLNPMGTVHGGFLATLLDGAARGAEHGHRGGAGRGHARREAVCPWHDDVCGAADGVSGGAVALRCAGRRGAGAWMACPGAPSAGSPLLVRIAPFGVGRHSDGCGAVAGAPPRTPRLKRRRG